MYNLNCVRRLKLLYAQVYLCLDYSIYNNIQSTNVSISSTLFFAFSVSYGYTTYQFIVTKKKIKGRVMARYICCQSKSIDNVIVI